VASLGRKFILRGLSAPGPVYPTADEGGMITGNRRLPTGALHGSRLGREIAWVIVLKVIALTLLYYLFFSPAHRPVADTAAHLLTPPEATSLQQSSER
jgi:hypothetical protein